MTTTTPAKNENDANVLPLPCSVHRSSLLVFSISCKFIHSIYPIFVVSVSMSFTENAVMRNAAHIPTAAQDSGRRQSRSTTHAKNHLFAQCTQRKLHFEVFSSIFSSSLRHTVEKKKNRKLLIVELGVRL